jgi:hypothetical protein
MLWKDCALKFEGNLSVRNSLQYFVVLCTSEQNVCIVYFCSCWWRHFDVKKSDFNRLNEEYSRWSDEYNRLNNAPNEERIHSRLENNAVETAAIRNDAGAVTASTFRSAEWMFSRSLGDQQFFEAQFTTSIITLTLTLARLRLVDARCIRAAKKRFC